MNTEQINIVERIRQGDRLAIEQAYDAYFTPVMNYVYHTVYNYHTAQDISQEAFLKVIKAITDKKKDVREFKPYLFQTARNLAIDEVKRSKKNVDYPVEAIVAEDPNIFADPARAALLTEQRAQVASATSKLNDNQRTALTLKDMEGWSYDDIGGLLGLSRNAVGVLLSRARLKFRREFRLQEIDIDGLAQECRNYLPLMSLVMDGEATEEQKEMLRSHLDACPLCRETMSEMAGAASTLRSLIPLAPVLVLKAGIVAKAVAIAGAGTAVTVVGAGMGALTKFVVGVTASVLVAGVGVGTFIGVKKAVQSPAPYVRVVLPVQGEEVTRNADHEGKARLKIIMEVDNEPHGVELAIDGQVAHSFEKGPYHYPWSTDQGGRHTLQPTALDGDGNRYPGEEVTFTLVLEEELAESVVYLEGGDIHVAQMDGSGDIKITSRGDIREFRPSPGGRMIAFVTRQSVIFLMDADGGNVRQVTLPEKGLAGNPVFDPGEKYMFFTRVDMEALDAMEAEQPFTLRFERYDITANDVTVAYEKGGMQPYSSAAELIFNPDGTQLYFTIQGSQWPNGEVYRLDIGPPVTEEKFMSRIMDSQWSEVVGFELLSMSSDGRYIAYNKNSISKKKGPGGSNVNVRVTCIRETAGGEEVILHSNDHFPDPRGDIRTVRFSAGDPSLYYFEKETQRGHEPLVDCVFYQGSTDDPAQNPTGLEIINISSWYLMVDNQAPDGG